MRRFAVLAVVAVLSPACSSDDAPDICREVYECITEKGTAARADLEQARDECVADNPVDYEDVCASEITAVREYSDATQDDEVACISPWATPNEGTDTPEQKAAYAGFQAALACNTLDLFGDEMAMYFSAEASARYSEWCSAGC